MQINTNFTPVTTHSIQCPPTSSISLLKTAIALISAEGLQLQGNILFDEGSQCSFITEDTAKQLHLKPTNTEHIAVAPFGAEYTSAQHLTVAYVNAETVTGDLIPISVLIVPFIAAPLQNSMLTSDKSFPYLKGLNLAHPITNEDNFQINILIGVDLN